MSISDTEDTTFDNDEFNFKLTEEDADFYAILNVPRNATPDDINKAYKQRCLIFHPDRHLDEDDKREAAKIFVLLKNAQETLTDPHLKAIYDTVGIHGINLEGWQLVNRSTNPENIKKEYEFLNRLRENEVMLQRIHPTSNFIFRSSIAGLFQTDADDEAECFSILGMSLTQSVDCAFSAVDRIGLTGRVRFNERGLGDGAVQLSYKRAISTTSHLENYLSIGPSLLSYSSKISMPLLPLSSDKLSWLNGTILMLQPSIQYNTAREFFDLSLIPTILFPLNTNLQGAITFNLAYKRDPSMTISIIHLELNQPKFILNFTISPILPSLRLTYHLRYPQHEQHYEANCLLSFAEITPSFTLERRFTKYSKVSVQFLISYPSFLLQANFRIKTSLNNYEFRFVLCEQQEDLARAALYGIVLPSLIMNASRIMFRRYLPKFTRIFEGRNVDEEAAEARKEQALNAVHLMRETAERIAREEERRQGLVIELAQYGQMAGDEHYPVPGPADRLIDVTIPLQALVNDSQLRIYSGKNQIPGFWDPCIGEPKILKVVYRFQGRLHSAICREDDPLMLPLRVHCIANE